MKCIICQLNRPRKGQFLCAVCEDDVDTVTIMIQEAVSQKHSKVREMSLADVMRDATVR